MSAQREPVIHQICSVCEGRDLGVTDGPNGDELPVVCGACTDTPRLALDLFCGQGGVAKGLSAARFNPVGVDSDPNQLKRYPYPCMLGDALETLRTLLAGGTVLGQGLEDFAFIWASCPCQASSDLQKQSKIEYPQLIGPTRELLEQTGKPYVIENVEGAELRDPVQLCGANDEHFPDLRVIRHRLFESNIALKGVPCPEKHPLCFTYDKRKKHKGRLDQDTSYVQVTGGGNCTVANKRAAMGTPWMTGYGCNEAIPPAYAEYIGRQVREHLAWQEFLYWDDFGSLEEAA